jgi:hypothetical protein
MGTAQHVFLWIVGALALIALASPAPDIATLLVIILIAGLVLAHYQDYVKYFGG